MSVLGSLLLVQCLLMEVNGLSTGQEKRNSDKRSLLITEWSKAKEYQKPTFADIVGKQKTYPIFFNTFVHNMFIKQRKKYLKNVLRDRLTRLK